MRALLLKVWNSVTDSYWAVPTLMTVCAGLLAVVLVQMELHGWLPQMSGLVWIDSTEPEGVRTLLGAIAGSMITVAGVTFSMTLVALSYAAGQVGPRLLNNFMRDRGNQITLGVFISTFLYCVLVLRTIHAGEAADADVPLAQKAFVPEIAVLVAMALAVASIGVLIYFIHHIPESIHMSNIVARVGREMQDEVERRFPGRIGSAPPSAGEGGVGRRVVEPEVPAWFRGQSAPVPARVRGYVQVLDAERLMEEAVAHDLVLRLHHRPGDFVHRGAPLMRVSPQTALTPELADRLHAAYVCGSQRTSHQNLLFMVDQLVEVANRALSPGVNDPFTACSCIDWLTDALVSIANNAPPDARRYDANGRLRVLASASGFETFASAVFDQIRPYAAGDRIAALRLMAAAGTACMLIDSPRHRRTLVRHARRLRLHARQALGSAADVADLVDANRRVLRLARDPDSEP